ncbi:MAG: PspC domain-containing protein [Chloroflexi bacterium HGW-Chloroflexi-2]|jgi:phage shock protein C|nr:MAG: PspC domain-containing protein [Chloroflexi bacterium HGW-Chloroflexi-2]
MTKKKLFRSKKERMIGGVCGGLANYFNIDPTIVRLIFVLSFFFLFKSSLLIYLLLLIFIPEEQ